MSFYDVGVVQVDVIERVQAIRQLISQKCSIVVMSRTNWICYCQTFLSIQQRLPKKQIEVKEGNRFKLNRFTAEVPEKVGVLSGLLTNRHIYYVCLLLLVSRRNHSTEQHILSRRNWLSWLRRKEQVEQKLLFVGDGKKTRMELLY